MDISTLRDWRFGAVPTRQFAIFTLIVIGMITAGLGTINFLHEGGWYDEGDVSVAQLLAALAAAALLELTNG